MGPSKSPAEQEYWRSKVNLPTPPAEVEAPLTEREKRAHALSALRSLVLVLCTFALCVTAVAVALIVT